MTGNPDWSKMTDEEVMAWMRPEGDQTLGLHTLCDLAIEPGMQCCEVGSFAGASARIILEYLHGKGQLWCVDPWENCWNGPEADKRVRECFDNFKRANSQMITQVVATSERAVDLVPVGQFFDFIYLDGLHEDIENDIIRWWPKLKFGGVLAGHDHSKHWPMVEKAVKEFFSRECLTLYTDSSWAVIKEDRTLCRRRS